MQTTGAAHGRTRGSGTASGVRVLVAAAHGRAHSRATADALTLSNVDGPVGGPTGADPLRDRNDADPLAGPSRSVLVGASPNSAEPI